MDNSTKLFFSCPNLQQNIRRKEMWCARYHQPLSASTFMVPRRKEISSPSTLSPSSFGKHQWRICNNSKIGLRLKPKANVVPPSESGDIASFLILSGALISMYLVTNFLVPDLLFKSLKGEGDEDEDSD